MSIKLAILPRTREGLSREGLQAYLADSHGPLVMAHGEVSAMFAGYVHHYVQDEPSPLGAALADRDALTIIHFARIEDMIASKASPAYAQIVGPDEDNFRELGGSLAMLLSETTVLAGPEDVARKLFIFRHGADAQDAEGWAAKLAPILAAQGEDGPIAAWRINTVARTLEGPAPAELFDEVSLRGPIPADLADALTAAAQAYFADAPASVLVTSPKIFVSSQRIETMEMSDSGLPPIQRVVTGHDENGRAIFKSEDVTPTKMIPSGDASFLTIWSTETVPADLNDERDGRDLPTGLTLERGSVIRITDMLPGKESPFHRTNSVDYGIVLKGEIELELDDGRKKTIREGGIIVQRGTNHLWRNTTDQVCRIAFILIEAPAYKHNDEPLDEAKPEQVHPAYGEMGE